MSQPRESVEASVSENPQYARRSSVRVTVGSYPAIFAASAAGAAASPETDEARTSPQPRDPLARGDVGAELQLSRNRALLSPRWPGVSTTTTLSPMPGGSSFLSTDWQSAARRQATAAPESRLQVDTMLRNAMKERRASAGIPGSAGGSAANASVHSLFAPLCTCFRTLHIFERKAL